MAYVQPTPATFKLRFPEFAAVSVDLIQLVLQEAFDEVGDTWLERDRARAQMLLTAHKLTMEGEPGRSVSGQGSAGTGAVRRRKVGDVEVEFATPGSVVGGFAATGYTATVYGQEYLALLKKNFPSPMVV